MVARHQLPPTVDVVRMRLAPAQPNPSRPPALAAFVSSLVDVTCDRDLLACARNAVLREVTGEWIVFIDDDTSIDARWLDRLVRDLERASGRPTVACSVGAARIDLPALDVAYRRSAIDLVGEFADPEIDTWTTDTEMQLRLVASGFEIQRGDRPAP